MDQIGTIPFARLPNIAVDVILPLLSPDTRALYLFLFRWRWNDPASPKHNTFVMSRKAMERGERTETRFHYGVGFGRRRLDRALGDLQAAGLLRGDQNRWTIVAFEPGDNVGDIVDAIDRAAPASRPNALARVAKIDLLDHLNALAEAQRSTRGTEAHMTHSHQNRTLAGLDAHLRITVCDEKTKDDEIPLRIHKNQLHTNSKQRVRATPVDPPKLVGAERLSLQSLIESVERGDAPTALKSYLVSWLKLVPSENGALAEVAQVVAEAQRTPEAAAIDALGAMQRQAIYTTRYFRGCVRRYDDTPATRTAAPVSRNVSATQTPIETFSLDTLAAGDYEALYGALIDASIPSVLIFGEEVRSTWPQGSVKHGFSREGVWATMWEAMFARERAWRDYAHSQGRQGINAYQEIDRSWPYTWLFSGEFPEWSDAEMDAKVRAFEAMFGDALDAGWSTTP